MTVDELVAAYREQAIIHGQASEDGNARRCNAAYDRLARIRRELRKKGPEQARRILELLDDEIQPYEAGPPRTRSRFHQRTA